MNTHRIRLFGWLPLLLIVCLAGCAKREEITIYSISTKKPDSLIRRDRMLGAIVASGQSVWFYKLVADTANVAPVEGDFKEWVKGIAYLQDEPVLDVPDAWQRIAPGQMQHAKFQIPVDEAMIQLSVAQLGKNGTWEEQVAVNVNRWRGQMGLEPSDAPWAGAEVLELEAAPTEDPAIWVALDGVFQSSAPMRGGAPPFAGGGGPAMASSDQPKLKLDFQMPDGWSEGRSGGMRLAAFNVASESGAAEVTVIEAGGDIRQNIAMWLSQVKPNSEPEAAVEALVSGSNAVTVMGKSGTRFRLFGDEDTDKAIDVAVIPLENGSSLFIKMSGDRETVRSAETQFTEFLASIKPSTS